MAFEDPNGKYGTGFWASGAVADRRLVIDLSKTIHILNSKDTPFYVLLSQISKETAAQPKFEWMEDEYFVTRSFTCNLRTEFDTSTGDGIVFLDLLNPNNVQALEAPPYIDNCSEYDITETALVKITANSGSFWVIIEKAGVEAAGTYTSMTAVTDALIVDVLAKAGAGTFLLDYFSTGAVQGYIIPIGYVVADAGDVWSPETDPFWHDETQGNVTNNYCVGLDDGSLSDDTGRISIANAPTGVAVPTAGVTYGTNATASKAYSAYVEVFTPGVLAKGFYEGSGLPEETRKNVRLLTNYTQIHKTPYSITNTAAASKYVGGDELARLRARKAKEHKIDLEQILLFNGASALSGTYDESPKRTTQGLGIGTNKAGFIKTHTPGLVTYAAGTHAASDYCIEYGANFYSNLRDACENIWDDQVEGSMTKTLFVSQKWLGAFSAYASAATPIAMTLNESAGAANATYGIRVMKYQSPFGLMNIIPAPVLRGVYEDYAFMIDFKNVALKTLPGRDTHMVTNAQQPDEDAYKEYLLTEMGLMVKHEQTHAILRLVVAT